MKRKNLKLFSLLLLTLSACSVHKTEFDCKAGKGAGCIALSKVNQMVSDDTLQAEIDKQNKVKKPTCTSCNKEAKSALLSSQNLKPSPMHRTQEKIMRIWFNSFFDEQNNFQGEQYIHTVIEPARWVAG